MWERGEKGRALEDSALPRCHLGPREQLYFSVCSSHLHLPINSDLFRVVALVPFRQLSVSLPLEEWLRTAGGQKAPSGGTGREPPPSSSPGSPWQFVSDESQKCHANFRGASSPGGRGHADTVQRGAGHEDLDFSGGGVCEGQVRGSWQRKQLQGRRQLWAATEFSLRRKPAVVGFFRRGWPRATEVICPSKEQVKWQDRVRNPRTWALTFCASMRNPMAWLEPAEESGRGKDPCLTAQVWSLAGTPLSLQGGRQAPWGR